ncbi:MAG TPA: hypothetical protein VMJ66_02220 [Geobacteraceae bacterium]|nr:hypothetical protein [Geobacteraceae bacterium]
MKKMTCMVLAAAVLMSTCLTNNAAFGAGHGGYYGGHGGYYGGHGGYYGWHGGYYGHGYGGVGVVINPWWGYPYGYPYYYPYPYYPYPYSPYYSSPAVVQQEPETYIQREPQQGDQGYYWYFCNDPKGYYPYVKKCPKGWQKVVPPATPSDEEAQ